MGLLFQPRWTSNRPGHVAPPAPGAVPFDRGTIFGTALEAVMIGDASRFADLFTDDVVFCSPHLVIESLEAVQRALGSPEDSLSGIALVVLHLDAIDDRVMGEWRLDARFTQAVMLDERLLLEPTGDEVHLVGASFAEFREHRIHSFRHYFDDSELLANIPGVPSHLRWRSDL